MTYLVPLGLCHQPLVDDFLRRDGGVPNIRFGGGRDNVFLELVVLHEAVGEVVPAVRAHALVVVRPNGSARRPRHVAPHDKLDRKHLALFHDRHVWVRGGQQRVRDDVSGVLEPPHARLIDHLTFEGDRSQVAVESALPVRRHGDHLILELVEIPHLSLRACVRAIERRREQSVSFERA